MPIAACLKVVNVELNKDIRDVKCTGAEKNKNIVDEDAKNTLYRLTLVHDDRRKRGTTDCFCCAALSNIWCQEMGIVCVPS